MSNNIIKEIVIKHFEFLKEKHINLEGEKPLPIIAIFFNEETGEVYSSKINENTDKLKKNEKFKKHAEVLGCIEIIKKGLQSKKMSVLISIPPCPDCYWMIRSLLKINKIFVIYSGNSKHKLHGMNKMNKLFKFEEIEMECLFIEKIGLSDLKAENSKWYKEIYRITNYSK